MTDINVLDLIPDDEKPTIEVTVEKPGWTKFHELAEPAYDAMLELKAKKEAFIKGHRNEKDYRAKKNYTINKTEVALACGTTNGNMIFRSNNGFATDALDMFENINKELEQKKVEKLKKEYTGLQKLKKGEVVKKAQSSRIENKQLKAKLAENALDALLFNMPIDIVQKLKLNRR